MEMQLILTTLIVYFRVALATPNQLAEEAPTGGVNDGGIVQENFRHFFDSLTKNDERKTGAYRDLLERTAAKEEQAFHMMKDELQSARQKNAFYRRSVYGKDGDIDRKVALFKRETPKPQKPGPTLPTTRSSSVGVYVNLTSAEFRLVNHPAERSSHQRLPMVGETNIEVMRKVDAIYVDKTEFVQKLMEGSARYVLLVRPRFFGKTFFINNLWYILEGKKHLFEDCHISRADSQYAWTEYEVLRFILTATSPIRNFADRLVKYANIHEVHRATNESAFEPEFISHLVEQIRVKNNKAKEVVILIDEYDRPLTMNAADERVRHYFHRLFAILQRLADDRTVRFVFLTGGSKVDLGTTTTTRIEDISMQEEYASICGFTEDEVKKYFGGNLHDIADKYKLKEAEVYEEMRAWYHGYRFTSNSTTVYNPASVIKYLGNEDHSTRLKNYWARTVDHPRTVLERMTKERLHGNQSFVDLRSRYKSEHLLNHVNTTHLDVRSDAMESLLFQHGYLTIGDANDDGYALRFPNKEVETVFIHGVALAFREQITEQVYNDTRTKMISALEDLNIEGVIGAFNDVIRKSSLPLHTEKGAQWLYRQALFLSFFILDPLPQNCYTTYRVLSSRRETLKKKIVINHVDVIIIETAKYIYVIGTGLEEDVVEVWGDVSIYDLPARAPDDTRLTARVAFIFLNDATIDEENWAGAMYEHTMDAYLELIQHKNRVTEPIY